MRIDSTSIFFFLGKWLPFSIAIGIVTGSLAALMDVCIVKINIEKYISPITSITKNTSIKRAIQVFNISHSRYLPVTQNRKLVGIVSLRDIRKSQLTLKKVKEIMTKNPYHLTTNHTKNDILKIISHLEKDYIPYTNKESVYLGMIDMNKLLKDLTFSIQKNKMCL